MSFLFPAFLAGLLTIAIPIIIHLLRRDLTPRTAFSDVRLLRRAPMLQTRHRRFREWLLLALRITALLLLALAFARPFVDAAGVVGRSVTVVMLDRSFSMGAPGVFDQARTAARDAIARAPTNALVGLVTFADRGTVMMDPTSAHDDVAAWLGRVDVGAGATRYAEALATAVDLIDGRPGHIVVVTDLQQTGWAEDAEAAIPSNVTLEVLEVSRTSDNLAVTGLVRHEETWRGLIRNTGAETKTTVVSWRVGDDLLETEDLELPPGLTEVVLPSTRPTASVLELAIQDPTGWPADDQRYLLLERPPPVRVLLVGDPAESDRGTFYLERALTAGGVDSPFETETVSPRQLADRPSDATDVIALVSTTGLDRGGRRWLAETVAGGGGLLVAAGSLVDPALVADALGADTPLGLGLRDGGGVLTLSIVEPRHPVFRVFGTQMATIEQVRFREAMVITQDPEITLARFIDGSVALAEYTVGDGRVLVFASDLNAGWNDFPLRPVFLPFVHETVRYLAGARSHRPEIEVADVPAGVPPEPGEAVDPASARRFVVNVNPQESEPSRITADDFRSRITQVASDPDRVDEARTVAAQESEQQYWWYLLAAMGLVLVAETWLARAAA